MGRCPDDPRLVSNLANSLWVFDELSEALSWSRWAVDKLARAEAAGSPLPGVIADPRIWRCLGSILADLGSFADADRACRRADPSGVDPDGQHNRSMIALGLGDFRSAWQLAEHRLRREHLPDGALPGPFWNGWPAAERLLIWSEQGLGDTIQFVRWLPQLLAGGYGVDLAVPPPLERLLRQGLAWMGGDLRVVARTASWSPPDDIACHGSLLSLPWRLEQPLPPWPSDQGYLRLQRPSVQRSGRLRVGLMWGAACYLDGHLRERQYRRKSLLGAPLAALLEGLRARPIDLVRLQVGPDRDPPELRGVDWSGDLDPQADFLELARALQDLDLLISVDTAAAHLAGAMGLRAWVLLPWAAASRWGRGSERTVWYPSLTLMRQPRHRDWQGLLPDLFSALDRWIAAA